ncbi:MAG: hemolysin family protein [Gemmataceae bacterium]|nr:hemolysin family protein [Gemmataceae bacterium]
MPAAEVAWYWTALSLLSVPGLVALNGFFVAAEFALVAIRRTRVEEMVNQGVPGARSVDAATDHLERAIAATQLGITLASIALGWVGEPALARIIEPAVAGLGGWGHTAAHSIATAIAFAFITFMHVVFGELIPKTVALQRSDTTAILVARPLMLFYRAAQPLITVMNGTGNRILKMFGFRSAHGAENIHSVEELRLLIEDTEEAGILDEEQADIVQNVFTLSDKCVRDIMVPRDRMATLDSAMTSEQIMSAVRAGAHTRMPVTDGGPNNFAGIVNTKDLFYLFSLRGVVLLEDALYPATYLEPEETVGTALALFKKSRKPMALVRNAEELVVGMLTLEDVIEEIVGDLEDEHDRPVVRKKIKLRRIRK